MLKDGQIKFGVLTGDVVPHPTPLDWDGIDNDIKLIGKTVYIAAGNHDLEDRLLFENRYGSTYYNFNFNKDLFIILDPNIDGWNISGEHLSFLKRIVKKVKNENSNIFIHQVLWWEPDNMYSKIRPNSIEGRTTPVNFWTDVEPIFSNLPNKILCIAAMSALFQMEMNLAIIIIKISP